MSSKNKNNTVFGGFWEIDFSISFSENVCLSLTKMGVLKSDKTLGPKDLKIYIHASPGAASDFFFHFFARTLCPVLGSAARIMPVPGTRAILPPVPGTRAILPPVPGTRKCPTRG